MLASKWDIYASLQDENNVHWLSIMNSFMVIIFLTGIIAHIVRKALRNDIKNYDEVLIYFLFYFIFSFFYFTPFLIF